MPTQAPRVCQRPCCPSYAAPGSPYCAIHRPAPFASLRIIEREQARPNANARGYNSKWRKARATYLAQHPTCAGFGVLAGNCGRPATVVDHKQPHKGNTALFWDVAGNWQPLCRSCHTRKTQAEGNAKPSPESGQK